MKGKLRLGLIVAFAGIVAGSAIAIVSTGARKAGASRFGAGNVPNALREAKFERARGKEADRGAASSPAAEEVANRAYPRSYVDDRLALKGRTQFAQLPHGRSAADVFHSALTSAPITAPWSELGPFTPNVAGPDSQFFDPSTGTGPTTQESGRVSALAIDPACAPGDCRMWVAAAGGGVWRTSDALATPVSWTPPPGDLPTDAFGSLYYDAAHNVLYAGSGEPNGSSDSEAGLGLFRSTDGGASWSLVPGSAAVATNRSIGAIAIDPSDPTGHTIYIGTDVARHGSSSVNGGRRTPPGAPALGVYKSSDNGASFTLESDLQSQTPPNPNPPSSGADWFQGGISKLEFDPNAPHELYAAVLGYGVWRSDQSLASPAWEQVFHTMNQNDFSDPSNPIGDSTGDRTEFDLVSVPGTPAHTRLYLGDSSDDWAIDDDPSTPLPEAWRVNSIDTKSAATLVNSAGTTPQTENPGWTRLSNSTNGTNGFAAYGWCQNGQCGYDSFVAHPPGADANTVWLGGSMNYDELPAYDQYGQGAPPRSNGRAVIRSTNGGTNRANAVTWQDMTAVLSDPSKAWGVANGEGIHPDLHAIAFANSGETAFIGSDGGVVRLDLSSPRDQSASCAQRKWNYNSADPTAAPSALEHADLADCQELLNGVPTSISPLNDGLRDLQFQSVSFNPQNPGGDLLGGTQDNGTWSFTGSPSWLETVGGDGGQSGFDAGSPTTRFHNYYDATPEVNFHGTDPNTWLDIYDPLQITSEARSFYTPFTADPHTAGRLFTGLQHVWRTDDNGGSEAALVANGCYATNLDPFRALPCGDWVPLGADLTGPAFGTDRQGDYVVATERAPSDNGTMWAATRTGRVFVTNNGDATPGAVQLFRIDNPSTPGRFVSGIAIDPANPNHAWVSYSGYNAYTATTPGHVFDVLYNPTSHSATFTDISHDMGDQPVTGVAEDEVSGAVFAATDFGVLELAPGASSWTRAGTMLPFDAVYGLTLSHQGRVLYAATHGRGTWKLALPAAPPKHPSGAIHGPPVLELGRKVTYTATGSSPNGGSVTFTWALPGKPASATGSAVTFKPTKLGLRTITLKVTDHTGASSIVTQAVRVKDTKQPTVRLRRVAAVHLGQSTKIRGSATDASGIRSVKLFFGDAASKRVRLSRRGTFTARHTYRNAKTYKVRLVASDKTHHRGSAARRARVRPR